MSGDLFNRHALKRARTRKGWSRAEFARRIISPPGVPRIDSQKIYRYETGEVSPKEAIIEILAATLGEEKRSFLLEDWAGQPVRFAVAPYPDYAFFSYCMSEAFSLAAPELSQEERSVKGLEVPLLYGETLERLQLSVDHPNAVEIALINETTWARKSKKDTSGRLTTKIWNLGPIIQFRGFAFLVTPWRQGTTSLRVFTQHYFDICNENTATDKPGQRLGELRKALCRTFTQLGQQSFDVFVPKETEMEEVFLNLLTDAAVEANEEEQSALSLLRTKIHGEKKNDHQAFNDFVQRLRDPGSKPAIYLGGLAHRQMAEENGALVLLGDSSLSQIASLNPKKYQDLVQPWILLLMRRDSLEMKRPLIKMIEHRWNLAVERLNREPMFRKRVEIARAFATEASLMVLDEPFGSLDALTKAVE